MLVVPYQIVQSRSCIQHVITNSPNVEFTTLEHFPGRCTSGELDLFSSGIVAYAEHSFHFLNLLSSFETPAVPLKNLEVGTSWKCWVSALTSGYIISLRTCYDLLAVDAIRVCIRAANRQ
ncbi:hypothetical protein Tco_1142984 [Tanacetum coccineum]